jgi:uncharacterized protein
METALLDLNVTFKSAVNLAGILEFPADLRCGEKRPAFIVLHGFGSHKAAANVLGPCKILSELGYIVLRFDMRGCGDSEGERGRLICLEQVEDTRAAIDFLSAQPQVDAARIGILGSSFGAAVAVYTAGVDDRIAAVVSSGGWGNGERKFQGQHPTPEKWRRFTQMLQEGREHFARTGTSLMVDRYDIVPIPDRLKGHVLERSIEKFPAETALSMFDFRAEEVIGAISPRPVLLLHSSDDSVTPTEQSIEMFKRAGRPTELHLFAETDHFMFAESNKRVHQLLTSWLNKYFPPGDRLANGDTNPLETHAAS